MAAILVYVTTTTRDEAEIIGRTVVTERLAACANVVNGMTSIYRWEGEVEQAQETVVLMKTIQERLQTLTIRIKTLHSHKIPCIVAVPITGGNLDYLDWIAAEVSL